MDNTEKLPTILSFCTGYGGIERGIERVIGRVRTLAHVEIEAYAIANMVAKMEAGKMVSAPVWTNVKTFPVEKFRNKVDILTAGYPCQPFSAAGKRKGKEDPRHLWPYIKRAITVIQPGICFFENVEGHISLGLREVLADLVGIGYRVESSCGEPTFGIFSAAEVGAPHQRKRLFILAYSERSGLRERLADCANGNGPLKQQQWKGTVSATSCSFKELADTNNAGQREFGGGKPVEAQQSASEHDCWPARPGQEQYKWEQPRVI